MNYEEMFFDYKKEPGKKLKSIRALGDNKPLVSIITSYYNAREYMMQTVNCVLNQTFPFWEWIIVDDGSTQEGTQEFLKSLTQKDSRIKVFQKENGGLAKGRDYGIQKATTDYVLPIDADDLIVDTYIETAYWSLETNPDASWAFSNSIGFGRQVYLYHPKFDSEKMKVDNLLTATALIRKSKILELGGYAVAKRYVNEDWHLWLRMLAKEYFPVQMNFYGFWYRRRKESLLSSINDEKKEENQMRLRDLEKEANKIQTIVQAKIYPNQKRNNEDKQLNWKPKDFHKVLQKNRVLYIVPCLGTDERLYQEIVKCYHNDYAITVITIKPSQYIYRQRIEEYAEVFDLTTFLDEEYWKSFIDYIVKTRQIQQICVANESCNIWEEYVKQRFSNIIIRRFEYKEEESLLKKQEKKYQRSKRIYCRAIKKIGRLLRKDVK